MNSRTRMRWPVFSSVLLFLVTEQSAADTIYLKSGETLSGAVEAENERQITIAIPGTGKVTLSKDVIASVEKGHAVAPVAGEELYAPRHGLRITKPAGWEIVYEHVPGQLPKESAQAASRFIWVFRENALQTSPQISVLWNVLKRDYGVEDYAGFLNRQNLKTQQVNPGLDIAENARIVALNGRPFIRTILLYQDQANIYYHFLRDRTSYTLGIITPRKNLDAYKTLSEKLAASIRFEEGTRLSGYDFATAEELGMLAAQYYSAGQYDDAIEVAEKALDKNPDQQLKASLLMNLSSDYLEKGIAPYQAGKEAAFYNKSLAYAQQCLAINPEFWTALGNIATVHMNTNDLAKADEYFTLAEKFAQQDSPYYRQLVAQHVEVKRRIQLAGEAGPVIGITLDNSWNASTGTAGGYFTYSKGPNLKFSIRRIENARKGALQWATDEAKYLLETTPPVTITQLPQQVRCKDRLWYEIRSESKAVVSGEDMLSVQWYSQEGPDVLEALLAGPKNEVESDLKNVQTALAEIRVGARTEDR